MAVSTDTFIFTPATATPNAVVPISGSATWIKAIKSGGLTIIDAATADHPILNPDAQITDSTRVLITRDEYAGTTLRVMLQYHTGDVPSTSLTPPAPLTIRVFGKQKLQDFWCALRNLNGDVSVPIAIDPTQDTQLTSAGMSCVIPDNNAHSWDLDGCNRILIGVESSYQPAAGGTPSVAILWAKVV